MAPGLALQQRIDVEKWLGFLPAGRKLDLGDTQVKSTRQCFVERRQARGLGVESDLHAHSFPSAEAASPETDERNDSTAPRDTNNMPVHCQQSAGEDPRGMMALEKRSHANRSHCGVAPFVIGHDQASPQLTRV